MISTCINHQDRPAPDRCKLCLKPICEECQVKASEGIFCSEDCKTKLQKQKANIVQTSIQAGVDKQKRESFGPLKSIMSFIMLLAGLGIAGYIAWLYLLPENIKAQFINTINSFLASKK